MRKWIPVLIFFLLPALCFASSASDRLKQSFNIKNTGPLDEYTLREVILKAIPPGSSSETALKRLEELGLDFRGTCFPGDTSPITCTIRSSSGTKKDNDPNFSFDFVFNKDNKISDVIVTRWYKDIVKSFVTTYKKPDNKIKLKSGLGVGSTIAELEKVYGRWEVDEVGHPEEGWPLTVNFYPKDNQLSLVVGIEIGAMVQIEFNELKGNQSRLRTMPAGIILYIK
jgi:hypothetical protein